MASTSDAQRLARLDRFFVSVLKGTTSVGSSAQYKQYIEAICAQSDHPLCVERIVASEHGIPSVQSAIRADLSVNALNNQAVSLLVYLQDHAVKTLSGGDCLTRILNAVVEPPTFWTAFCNAFMQRKLREPAQKCFAWLLLQLLRIPSESVSPYLPVAQTAEALFIGSPHLDVRKLGQEIKHTVALLQTPPPTTVTSSEEASAGGRHDNDFADFREIAILPTTEELSCKELPFLRTSAALYHPSVELFRESMYIDNVFRLLREDMLYEMREEVQIALGNVKGRKHRGFVVENLKIDNCSVGDSGRRKPWSMIFSCAHDLRIFHGIKPSHRKKALMDNPRILKHQSLTSLIIDGEVIAFPTVRREEDLLAENPPRIVLELDGEHAIQKVLLQVKKAQTIKLIQIDVAVFAYEPVLNALKSMRVLPLASELLFWKEGDSPGLHNLPLKLASVVERLRSCRGHDIGSVVPLTKRVVLDTAQEEALLSGLTQTVSLIQGPPGTGKSFIGALLARTIHHFSPLKILVVCYTNHALDQFLEDMMDIGIDEASMVRIGGKSTARTEPLLLQRQTPGFSFSRADNSILSSLKSDIETHADTLTSSFHRYLQSSITNHDLMAYLEFEEVDFFNAFEVPASNDGMQRVGARGRAVDSNYLIQRWRTSKGPGVFSRADNVRSAAGIWSLPTVSRAALLTEWMENITREDIDQLYQTAHRYNKLVVELTRKFREKDRYILKQKRIIGCTTTAAAKYTLDIIEAAPDVILVEEAGEILESHVVTALGKSAKQLILIGDHKQLRPKVNNYNLTVEKNEGYDLNRSLFERLVLKGYPHQTLQAQHRMRPEISALIRELTYPDLVDAPKTQNRPDIRGLQDNIVFINHDYPEDELKRVSDLKDMGSKSSKQNHYEARMVLKIVKYLSQQGYGTDKIVVLTPYLGQLHKLRDELREETDPVLNDLDSHDLVRAGLMTAGASKSTKQRLRLATIDNYQGEESHIVVVSLTRSNSDNNIGFMYSPERLNVLLSRARDGLIMIGNSNTFTKSKSGGDLWKRLFVKMQQHVYDGLPIQCQQHPDRKALISTEVAFESTCPDGGCSEPCGTTLNCGLHKCPSKCHQLYDHSKMECREIVPLQCPKGHDRSRMCSAGPSPSCPKCDRAAKLAEKKRQEEFARQKKRDEDEAEHLRKIKDLEEKRSELQQAIRDAQLRGEREHEIHQREADLEAAISVLQSATSTTAACTPPPRNPSPPPSPPSADPTTSSPPEQGPSQISPSVPHSAVPATVIEVSTPPASMGPSPSESRWAHKKAVEGIVNPSIDSIMEMTGLEDVKTQVLRILDKIDIAMRQGIPFQKERYNLVLLGNPGTGKTTVARHYARYLSSVNALPGNAFEETTGSRLASDGIKGAKDLLEKVKNAGGGTVFIDEAYQLTSAHNHGGATVLDFLLAEMENNIGTIVFILAGYNKEMESFFEHNPGLNSRIPYRFQFRDYTDDELRMMLEKMIQRKYNGRMKVEHGVHGLYGRIVTRRLGRGRGTDGFGNARALENLLTQIMTRQAARIGKERMTPGSRPDDMLFVKEDLIGPDPAAAILESTSWSSLQKLTGLSLVKRSVHDLYDMVLRNYGRELREEEPLAVPLNRTFIGSPGTGKTTVAKLYGQILADLGLLSNGEVVIKNPADFIGSALGQSESQTKAILANTKGKVLIIDEAYMLHTGGSSGQQSDPYKTAVIDTIVAEVQSTVGEDRCVLLLGYEKEMRDMFQAVNPGLSRRFRIEDAFKFEDFTSDELVEILELKLKQQSLAATAEAKKTAIDVLERAKMRPKFGNGGEVENCITNAKTNYVNRTRGSPSADQIIFEPIDFDPAVNRGDKAGDNLTALFKDVVGCDDVVAMLRRFQDRARTGKRMGIAVADTVPTTFVFKGPPGTGKTTTARKMGEVYADMGLLSRPVVHECSASELIAQYMGQTGPLVQRKFEESVGQVLFIDEAYRLKDGHYAKEATDEIVTLLTDERYRGKMVVILAGYDNDINELLRSNRGLSSRFTQEVLFVNLQPKEAITILRNDLEKNDVKLEGLNDESSTVYHGLIQIVQAFSTLQSWGNARDVKTLAKEMIGIAMEHSVGDHLFLDPETALECARDMLKSRMAREDVGESPVDGSHVSDTVRLPPPPPPVASPPVMKTTTTVTRAQSPRNADHGPVPLEVSQRDDGVSDAVWAELERAKAASLEEAQKLESAIQAAKEATQREIEEKRRTQDLEDALKKEQDRAKQDALKKAREEQRLREIDAMRRRGEAEERRLALEQERKREAVAQRKLREIGVCVAGYKWVKIPSGYRCIAGGHFVSDAQLGM